MSVRVTSLVQPSALYNTALHMRLERRPVLRLKKSSSFYLRKRISNDDALQQDLFSRNLPFSIRIFQNGYSTIFFCLAAYICELFHRNMRGNGGGGGEMLQDQDSIENLKCGKLIKIF
ncbi:hypothetical protein TNCV_4616171 [Trichonephila clavipes]|nr:hypothetical protein TNCV_4616171 [Trichonephila clavipes]